jgi:hypothetical protein
VLTWGSLWIMAKQENQAPPAEQRL